MNARTRRELEFREMLSGLPRWQLVIVVCMVQALIARSWLRQHGLWIG